MAWAIQNLIRLCFVKHPSAKKRNCTQRFIDCREEETAFSKTLDKGIELFQKRVRALNGCKTLSGEDAFQLYDTFGFPLDLTQVTYSCCNANTCSPAMSVLK